MHDKMHTEGYTAHGYECKHTREKREREVVWRCDSDATLLIIQKVFTDSPMGAVYPALHLCASMCVRMMFMHVCVRRGKAERLSIINVPEERKRQNLALTLSPNFLQVFIIIRLL